MRSDEAIKYNFVCSCCRGDATSAPNEENMPIQSDFLTILFSCIKLPSYYCTVYTVLCRYVIFTHFHSCTTVLFLYFFTIFGQYLSNLPFQRPHQPQRLDSKGLLKVGRMPEIVAARQQRAKGLSYEKLAIVQLFICNKGK